MTGDAPIELAAYDPSWPLKFESERTLLAPLLAPWLAGRIEHIGSTAVPLLAAKPIIDIAAPVQSLEASRAAIEALTGAGYAYWPYKAEVMHWFCKPSPELRTHHLHLVPIDSPLWRERLAFRDALRASPALAAEYADLKRRLAEQYRDNREAYTEAKAPFVRQVLSSLLEIRVDDLRGPEIAQLLQEHLRGMAQHSPADSMHALDIEGLRRPEVTFWSAWHGPELVGCGALKELDAGHAEIKSMRTATTHLRKGVAAAIMRHMLQVARQRSYRRLSLETGAPHAFAPARRLYASFGFLECSPFADYVEDPYSVFMTLEL
ncbi:MAG: GNAT family N-acetyltransferase [Betaproteobacteria bacterium]